jgi:NUMOD3 motif
MGPRPDMIEVNRKRWTPEDRAELSERNKGNKYATGFRNALGYHHTAETKAKLSAAALGNKYRLGLTPWNLGRPHTAATRAAMSVAWTHERRAAASVKITGLFETSSWPFLKRNSR